MHAGIRLRRATFHTVIKKMSNATQEEEDLEAVVAKLISRHEAVAAIFVLDGGITTPQSWFCAPSKRKLQMDTTRAVE